MKYDLTARDAVLRKGATAMQSSVLRSIGRFLADAAEAMGTPSGDTRGHVRVYALDRKVGRGRNF